MQLFYNPSLTPSTKHLRLDRIESRHAVRVLRKKVGDHIFITNGNGILFTGEITYANDRTCELNIVELVERDKHPYYLHIAIAPTKNNDRFEWFLEKATEIGIDEITPIICDNSERKVIKMERMNRILESALKQSLRYHLPKLNEPIPFRQFVTISSKSIGYIAHCEEEEKPMLKDIIKPNQNYTLLIGPEGDFSTNEIKSACAANYTPISLGKARLRTETAGIVATHTVALVNE